MSNFKIQVEVNAPLAPPPTPCEET